MVDYSKWDKFVDSDEEREKARFAEVEKDKREFAEKRRKDREAITQSHNAKLQCKLVESGLFAGVVAKFMPEGFLEVRWGEEGVALLGNVLSFAELRRVPEMTFDSPEPTALRTILMLSVSNFECPTIEPGTAGVKFHKPPQLFPDVERRHDEDSKEVALLEELPDNVLATATAAAKDVWVHWLCLNALGPKCLGGKQVIEYCATGAPSGQTRRYFVILLKQRDGELSWAQPVVSASAAEGRSGFDASQFAKTHNLRAVAANCVRSKPTE
eukprot:RCo016481